MSKNMTTDLDTQKSEIIIFKTMNSGDTLLIYNQKMHRINR